MSGAVDRHVESTVGPPYIDFETHNLKAKLLYQAGGLSGYWGLVSAYESDHDETIDQFEAAGHTWEITECKHWNGGIAPPESADWDTGEDDTDGLYEYIYKLEATDVELPEDATSDDTDLNVNFQFKPRYPNAENVQSGEPISGSHNWPEGLAAHVNSTNLEFHEALQVLHALARTIDLNPWYLTQPHPTVSRITNFEMYVRGDRDVIDEKITGTEGKIREIAEYAASEATSGHHSWSTDENEGHFRKFKGDSYAHELMYPAEEYPALGQKGYHPKYVRTDIEETEDDPLNHPKFEVSFESSYHDGALTLGELGELRRKMCEVGWNTLHWAGVSLDPDAPHWIETDPHFDVDAAPAGRTRNAQITDDPLPDLRERSIKNTTAAIAETTITDARQRILEVLADHGEIHAKDLAEKADVARSTAYRLLDALPILQSDNGVISFPDAPTRDTVSELIDRVKGVSDWATDQLAGMEETAKALRDDDGALTKWMQRHGVDLVTEHPHLEFDLGPVMSRSEAIEIVRAGLKAARQSTILTTEFYDATVHYSSQGERNTFVKVAVQQGRYQYLVGTNTAIHRIG